MTGELLKKIDIRNTTDADGNVYFVVFCSRDSENPSTKPGHAYMVWGVEDKQASISTQKSFGFYPRDDDAGKALFGTIPGYLADEATKKTPSDLLTARLIVQTNKGPFFSSQHLIDEWRTSDYNLYKKNCIHFVRSVALSLGLFPPPVPTLQLPSSYMKDLVMLTSL